MTPEVETILLLDPADVLADDNSRFSLKKLRVDSLMNSIKELGEVTEPVEVEERDKAEITKASPQHYRLTKGFYRHQAATRLNAEENVGAFLPARVKTLGDSITRLKRQLAENMERENQSPMDKAVAIKKLMDLEVPRAEIRRLFATPGGRKGLQLQAASNSFINIMLNLLELPKAIQEKIHDGRVGVAAAYELGKVTPDKRAAVLERAENERLRQLEVEEKDEDKLLSQEKKVTVAQEEAQSAVSLMEEAKAAVNQAIELVTIKTDTLRTIQKEPLGDGRGYLELKPEEKAQVTEKVKAAEADVKSAEKLLKESTKHVDKLEGKVKKASEIAEQTRKKIEEARKPKKGKKVGAKDIKRAASAEGAGPEHVKLNANEMRGVIDELASGSTAIPKVAAIGAIIKGCFDGIDTPQTMTAKLYQHMGLTVPKR